MFTLNLMGFIISFYLIYNHYFASSYFCPIVNNCDKVLTSKYNKIFNIPISLLGTIYFLTVLTFLKLKFQVFIQFLIFTGFLAGLILLYLQIFVLRTVCFYCFIVDSILLVSPTILILEKINKGRNLI